MNRKTGALILMVSALLFISVVAVPPASAATTLGLACPSAPTTPTGKAAYHFAERVKERSKGSLLIKVFPSGQLGTGDKAILAMQTGSIDIVEEDLVRYAKLVKEYGALGWGFFFRDREHLKKFLASSLNAELKSNLADKAGIVIIADNWRKLPREVVSRKPVFRPEDLAGMKFRVPGIMTYIRTWKALGAAPTKVPWGEAFMALKQGTVDAMESPFETIVGQKFHLAAPYVTMTDHILSVMSLAMNKKKYDSLSAEQREVLAAAAEDTAAFMEELVGAAYKKSFDQILKDGGSVIFVDTEPFQKKLLPEIPKLEEEGLWGKGFYEKVQALR